VLYLTALQGTGDADAYAIALRKAAKTQHSPNFQFMLLEMYMTEEDHDKAVQCIDGFMAAVERDAALLALKGQLLLKKGSTDAALEAVKEALRLEPDSVFVHSQGLDVLLAGRDHSAVAASLHFLEAHGGRSFKGALIYPAWADFVKSTESAPWR
jgi:predicted Zn-dependent protease